ncbi:MAG: WbqC family protein [Bacteroidota bacterium]
MKIAIMQPYFFPYIGYFQLINSVDVFVVYDDVNFIKQGWIHKNRILSNKESYSISLQLTGVSSFKKINEISIGGNRHKALKTIEESYKKAPYFTEVYPIVATIFSEKENNLSGFLVFALKQIAGFLEINTKFMISSQIEKNNSLKGKDKVLEICSLLNADEYINAIGGQELYDKAEFSEKNIGLHFIQSKPIVYKQFANDFVPWLSIIDVLMFNSKETVRKMLNDYELK